MKAAQEEERKEKARVRVEKMLAKKSGATTQMPLEGKAALAFIKGGQEMATKIGPREQKLRDMRSDPLKAEKQARPGAPVPVSSPAEIDEQARKGTPAKPKAPAKRKAPAKPKGKSMPKSKAKHNGKDTKLQSIVQLLKRKEGCTNAEVLKVTGWPSVSMPQVARSAGLKLVKEKKKGELMRYRSA